MIKKEYILLKIKDLIPYEKNNKKHKEKDISEVAKSIKESNYLAPIIIDENNVLLVWHWRLEALKKLKYKEVEVLKVWWLSEKQKKKYRIKDNTTSLFAEFDFENILQEVLSLWEEWLDLVWHLEGLENFWNLNFFWETLEFNEEIQDEIPEFEEKEKILNNSTKTWDKVLDLFWWSGSTLIACEKKKRICFMMELDPEYCQTIIKRFYNVTNGSKEIKCLNRKIDFSFL